MHPFGDGNGRVGRVLLSIMACIGCQHEKPRLYLSPFFERNKSAYIRLARVRTSEF
ncbi:MAG: hypothetical protein HOH33_01430 [Verrucomicrobia bacterium]|nr:hypothetical protein [Verrucomicrobiota bacterium]